MIYKVNAQLLKMLNDSDFRPANKEVLEAIINAPRKAYKLNRAFDEFEKWYKVIPKNNNTCVDAILGACTGLYTYYFYLKEHLESASNYTQIYKRINDLEHHNAMYFEEHTHEMFYLMANCFTLTKGNIPEIKLADNISKDDVEFLYKCFIGAYSKLFHLISILEKELQTLNEYSWSGMVMGNDWEALTKLVTLGNQCYQLIPTSQFAIVSFCEDPSKLYYSTQDAISASLINTQNRKSFHDRSYGFMYSFSTDNLFAMSFEDANSSCWWDNTLKHLIELLIEGEPLLSVIQGIEASPIDLRPLYKFDELLEKTIKYNEILLKPETKPYGIFVYEEKLGDCFNQACSLCTIFRIPLFICRKDGSMVVIDWRDVFNQAERIDS